MKIKTSITLSQELLTEMDKLVQDTPRSAVIEEAVRRYLKELRRKKRDKTDLAILNKASSRLNKEAEDVLSYQVEL